MRGYSGPVIQVALLRGINVGGNNRVPMADLREVFASLGYTEVATYINSGNVVFEADSADHLAMAAGIEDAIEARFGFRCRVLVRSGADIEAIARAVPPDWQNGPDMKTDVVYLLDGVDPSAAVEQLSPQDGVDNVLIAPGAVIWMVTKSNATRNGLLRMVGTDLYSLATVRNVNTARKLRDLVQARNPD